MVDKPIALPTHAPQEDPCDADVVGVLRRQLGAKYLGVHQRLDADTSGVILFALRREANASLATAFAQRDVEKHYVALVRGAPAHDHGVIDLPIAPASGGLRAIARPEDPMARDALTRYAVRARADDGSCALVDLYPSTGRTHQLRLHLRALGTPIVGDRLYDRAHAFPRLMLHAHALTLPHPATGLPSRFVAPLPAGFGELSVVLDEASALRMALARRQPLTDDATTTAYRLVNGEADGLAGIEIDRLGERVLVSGGDARQRSRLVRLVESCAPTLAAIVSDEDAGSPRDIVEAGNAPTGDTDAAGRSAGSEELPVVIDGLPYIAIRSAGRTDPPLVYRETIARMRVWSTGRRVLCCGVSASGLALAALSTCDDLFVVERSRAAVARLHRCAVGAGIADRRFGLVTGELHEQLERLQRRGRQFELVVLDARAVLARARRSGWDARHVGRIALALTAHQGLAVLVSDDGLVTRRAYRRTLLGAFDDGESDVEIVALHGASAIDFPGVGDESALKVLVVRRR